MIKNLKEYRYNRGRELYEDEARLLDIESDWLRRKLSKNAYINWHKEAYIPSIAFLFDKWAGWSL